MSNFLFVFVFFLVVILILFLIFYQKIMVFLYPDDYAYIHMENDEKLNLFIEKIKDKVSFKYREGVYFFDIPEERPKAELVIPKPPMIEEEENAI